MNVKSVEESITSLAQRLYDVYRGAHPYGIGKPRWEKLGEEFREIWYAVAVEARK
jgi:hypothetical protein